MPLPPLVHHPTPATCPRVRTGEWGWCLGHPATPPIKKKRRRVDVQFRLEEARAALQAVEDARDWVRDAGELDRLAPYVGRLERVAGKLRRGIEYVVQGNPSVRSTGFVIEVDPTGGRVRILVEVTDQARRWYALPDGMPCLADELLAHTVEIEPTRLWCAAAGWFNVREVA